MAKLYIAEYDRMCQLPNAGPQCPEEPPLAEQVLDFSGGVQVSAFFQQTTKCIRLNTDATCSVLFGQAPTAATSNQRFAANQTEYKGVKTGGQYKVSVISNT